MIGLDGSVIRLDGRCPVEDAEPLLALLQEGAATALDLGSCQAVHTAVLQLLLACGLPLRIPPADPLLAGLLARVTAAEGVAL